MRTRPVISTLTGPVLALALAAAASSALAQVSTVGSAPAPDAFTREFFLENCDFASRGENPFFILEPGYRQVFEGVEDGEQVVNVITVLDETIHVGGVEARVVREHETHDGELVEISKNYFAICKQTNSVLYFGEDVNIYEHGRIVSHDGSWHAGVDGARPGLIMSGTQLLGGRYFQEIAPKVALDRAEIVSLDAVVQTPLGRFKNCLKTRETTLLDPGAAEFKAYAPGVGQVQDDTLLLVRAFFVDGDDGD